MKLTGNDTDRKKYYSDSIVAKINNTLDMDNKNNGYDDISRFKAVIKDKLINNTDILMALHNPDLEAKLTEEEKIAHLNTIGNAYYNVNIFSFLKMPDVQNTVKNFVCFEVEDEEEPYGTNNLITRQIIFRPVSHEDDVKTDFGIDRQDLLALMIKDTFNWANFLGKQWKKVYDVAKVAANGYYYRDIRYETNVSNNLVDKFVNGKKDLHWSSGM